MQEIWAVYERETGKFAGSGTPRFDDSIYGSTLILPKNAGAVWDDATQDWTYNPSLDDAP
jgi:hypothetical protein